MLILIPARTIANASRRRLALPALAALLGATIVACDPVTAPDDDGVVVGNGQLVQTSRQVFGISGVNHAGEGSLEIILGSTESLIIEAESNLQPHLETFQAGGILRLRVSPDVDIRETLPIRYVLTVTGLDSIALRGVGDVSIEGLQTDQLALTLAGVGDIVVSGLAADTLTASLSGVGDLVVSGQVTIQTLDLSGVGHADHRGLQSSEAEVSLTAAASATVRVSDRLRVNCSGGTVFYIGDPAVFADPASLGCAVKITG